MMANLIKAVKPAHNFCLRSYICCMAIEVEYKDDKCYGPYNACRHMLATTR